MASRIEVHDLVTFVQHVEHQKGKYIKQIMRKIEKEGKKDPVIRKHVLDGMSSFARSIYQRWYDIED